LIKANTELESLKTKYDAKQNVFDKLKHDFDSAKEHAQISYQNLQSIVNDQNGKLAEHEAEIESLKSRLSDGLAESASKVTREEARAAVVAICRDVLQQATARSFSIDSLVQELQAAMRGATRAREEIRQRQEQRSNSGTNDGNATSTGDSSTDGITESLATSGISGDQEMEL
jgi:chromosome segregation ATPase